MSEVTIIYDPGCGYCTELKELWTTLTVPQNIKVTWTLFDNSDYKGGVPYIYATVNGKKEEFNGERTKVALEKWLNKLSENKQSGGRRRRRSKKKTNKKTKSKRKHTKCRKRKKGCKIYNFKLF
jgi:hypothetical protein